MPGARMSPLISDPAVLRTDILTLTDTPPAATPSGTWRRGLAQARIQRLPGDVHATFGSDAAPYETAAARRPVRRIQTTAGCTKLAST